MFDWLKRTHIFMIAGPTGITTIKIRYWWWSAPHIIDVICEKSNLRGKHSSVVCIGERTEWIYPREEDEEDET